jgi:DNA-binding transcriptional LysR family regulator
MSMLEPDGGLACIHLETNRLALLVPQDHKLARRSVIEFQDIAAWPVILREEGSVTRALVERALLDLACPLTPILAVHGNAGVKEAVAAGIGVAPIFASEAGQDVRLKAIPLRGQNLTAGLYLVTLAENLEMPAVAAFAAVARGS